MLGEIAIDNVYRKLFDNDNQIVKFNLYDFSVKSKYCDLENCIKLYFKRFS